MKKHLGKFLALILALRMVGWLVYDYSQREYWVYITKDPPALEGVTVELDREIYCCRIFCRCRRNANRGTQSPRRPFPPDPWALPLRPLL